MHEHPPTAPDDELLPEIRWPALLAVLAVAGLHTAVPPSLSAVPRWLPLIMLPLLGISSMIAHYRGRHELNRILGFVTAGVITVLMLWSLVMLIMALPERKETPGMLMRSALALWLTNVLVFALWYWRLDAGGPTNRDQRPGHSSGSFLFPQMNMPDGGRKHHDGQIWSPNFVDYLFLAFNTSTAFSPTDTAVLSRWAKVLTMLQASISLAVIAGLGARAVNIL